MLKRLLNANFFGIVALMAAIVGIVGFATKAAEAKVEQAVRQNFTAAGLLARIQVQGEKMRRYEKEMFIYAAAPASRAKYVKEFDDAHSKLLSLLTEATMPSNKAFSPEERKEVLSWLEATAFYTSEFRKIAGTADATPVDSLSLEQKANLTVKFNGDIKDGKDRFAGLLNGTAKMREAKEQASLSINTDVDNVFRTLLLAVIGVAVAVIVGVGVLMGRQSARPAQAMRGQHSSQFAGSRAH